MTQTPRSPTSLPPEPVSLRQAFWFWLRLWLASFGQVLASVDVEAKAVQCNRLCQASLHGGVDLKCVRVGDGFVAVVNHWQLCSARHAERIDCAEHHCCAANVNEGDFELGLWVFAELVIPSGRGVALQEFIDCIGPAQVGQAILLFDMVVDADLAQSVEINKLASGHWRGVWCRHSGLRNKGICFLRPIICESLLVVKDFC